MLLCGDGISTGCDRGYHLQCLDSGLTFIPTGDWLCPECTPEDEDEGDYDPDVR